MNEYRNLSKIQKTKKKIRIFPILLVILLVIILFSAILVTINIYQQADKLVRKESEPFPDVSENAMPIHSSVAFNSIDNNTLLEGWYFQNTADFFRGNIIFVHNNHSNRVQFSLETADLFSSLMDAGFNVLAFDLRNSGRSGGNISSYGYSEHEDVLAAINYMKLLTNKSDIILYGIGTGTFASMIAWDYLPSESGVQSELTEESSSMNVTKEDVIGFILDTPAASVDDYIRADLPSNSFYDKYIARRFIPSAVKATASGDHDSNMTALVSKIQVPVLITRNLPDTKIEKESIDKFITERIALHPVTTIVFETAEPGHLEGFSLQPKKYLSQIHGFLDTWYEAIIDN